MKRKTIILLSSVLAGSLLVGGAFAAYAVTDNANPIGVDVRTQASDQDTPVEIMWGEEAHADIADLDSGKYAKAGYFTVKSTVEYEGTFSVKMADKTPQAIIDAKGTEEPVFLFDNLEVFVYSGHVALDDGNIPAELPEGVELVGSISTNTAKQEDGSKLWSKLVTTDLDGKVFTVLVKSEATEDVLGQLSQDVVGLTIDWGMGPNSHEAQTEGYFLKLGDANPTALTENTDTDKTDGRIAEYTTTKEVVAGQAIKIVKDGVAVDSEHVTFEENGNATSAGNIVASGESTFWIKVYNGQDESVGQLFYVVYVTNPSSGVVVDDNVIYGTIDNGEHWGNLAQLTLNPTKQTEVYIEGLELAAGTEFTIHLTGDTYMEFTNIKASSPAKDNFEQKKGDIADRYDNIVVKTAGTYDFYVDAGEDNGIYITETSGEQEETDYKLVGTIGGTDKWAYADGIQVTKLSNNQYQVASVELLAGDAIKMWNGKSGEQASWLGVSEAYANCGWTVGDNGNCVINEAGTYKVDIYMDNDNHIVITAL